MAKITEHANQRAKERCGINKQSINRIADRVLKNGLTHKECSGQLKRWVDKLYLESRKANNIRLYGEKAYLFHNNTLITILPVPNNLKSHVKKLIAKRIEKEEDARKKTS